MLSVDQSGQSLSVKGLSSLRKLPKIVFYPTLIKDVGCPLHPESKQIIQSFKFKISRIPFNLIILILNF